MKLTPAAKLYPVTPTVHGWAAFQTEWKVHFNSYALQTSDGLVLIDPTQPSTAVLKKLEALGTPAAVILTNAHHDRAADWFRKAFEVQIYASENAAADCDTKIDVPVMDGEKLPGGLQAIFLPGVSPSEMALLGSGILHLGDALLHTPGKGLELMPDQFISDKKQYRASLQKLLPLEFEVVTFCHGEPLLQAGHATLAKFLKPRR